MSEPSEKHPVLTQFLQENFGRTTAIQADLCVSCGKPADQFRNSLSAKEYRISGLCQACQDSVFGVD